MVATPDTVRALVERHYEHHIAELDRCPSWRSLVEGRASREDYDAFTAQLIRTHIHSPARVAMLYAICPAKARARLQHNLLEELGTPGTLGHPALLLGLARAAGLEPLLPTLEGLADDDVQQVVTSRLIYPTLRELGLALCIEVFAFEVMLSSRASTMARFLAAHRGLDDQALLWFTHHAEVDVGHAEEAYETLAEYVEHYRIGAEDLETIADMATRENLFIKRYFGPSVHAEVRGMVSP